MVNRPGIICGDLSTTGDGVIAALQVLAAVRTSGKASRFSPQASMPCLRCW